jgi:hypothetical protein
MDGNPSVGPLWRSWLASTVQVSPGSALPANSQSSLGTHLGTAPLRRRSHNRFLMKLKGMFKPCHPKRSVDRYGLPNWMICTCGCAKSN